MHGPKMAITKAKKYNTTVTKYYTDVYEMFCTCFIQAVKLKYYNNCQTEHKKKVFFIYNFNLLYMLIVREKVT